MFGDADGTFTGGVEQIGGNMTRFEHLQSMTYEDFVHWLDYVLEDGRSTVTNTICRECKERVIIKGGFYANGKHRTKCKHKECLFLGQSQLEELKDYLNYEIKEGDRI
jgi:hypothetical protein